MPNQLIAALAARFEASSLIEEFEAEDRLSRIRLMIGRDNYFLLFHPQTEGDYEAFEEDVLF